MASLNWGKNRQNKKIQEQLSNDIRRKQERSDFRIFLEKGLWPIKGKHKGKVISDLDENYLKWIRSNLKGIPKKLAAKELRRRQKSKGNKNST